MWNVALAGLLCLLLPAGAAVPALTAAEAAYLQDVRSFLVAFANNTAADPSIEAALRELDQRLAEAEAAPQEEAHDEGVAGSRAELPEGPLEEQALAAAATAEAGVASALPGAFRPEGQMRFRAVLEGGRRPRASSVAGGEQLSLVNPFLFDLGGQRLRFRPVPGLCASVQEGGAGAEEGVVLEDCQDAAASQWAVLDGKITVGANQTSCLAVRGGKVKDNADVVAAQCGNAGVGSWMLDGERIRASANPDYCLAVREGRVDAGSSLVLLSCDQAFTVADWIVVGGGASGCAAAAALADAGENVVVVERGRSDLEMPETKTAATWPQVVNSEAVEVIRWQDGTWGAVAQVLGGGTSINGGLYIEEVPDVLTAALGSSLDLDSFYESSRYLADALTKFVQPTTYGQDYARALQEAGIAQGSPAQQLRWSDGAWVPRSTIDTTAPAPWPRRGAAALLHDRSGLPNLEVMTQTKVRKVAFNGTKATGVHVIRNGVRMFLPAAKGVILAAGAIYTPQLLQVSGIGDAELLGRLGVPAVVPGLPVGKNFIDRPVLSLGVWSRLPVPLTIGYTMAASRSLGLTLESVGGGRIASEFTIASLAFAAPSGRTELLRWTFRLLFSTPIANILNSMLQLVSLQHAPASRGEVRATSAEGRGAPSVRANHLSAPADMAKQLEAMETLLELIRTPSLQRYTMPKAWTPPFIPLPDFMSCFAQTPADDIGGIVFPCQPGPGASRARMEEFLRNIIVSSYHYFGTAATGTVVEGPDFRVKGTANLHVVDASAFALPTRVNPQGTIMALGHYAGKKLAARSGRRLHGQAEAPRLEVGPTTFV